MKISPNKRLRGTSLLEILVVIAIFSILGILATRAVLLTLRGTRKSDSIVRVRENLNYSLSVIERGLRNADTVSCPSGFRVDYTDQAGKAAYFSCENMPTGYVASASARLTSTEIQVTSCAISCTAGASGVPPSVTINMTGQDISAVGIESAQVSVSSKIFLRTY